MENLAIDRFPRANSPEAVEGNIMGLLLNKVPIGHRRYGYHHYDYYGEHRSSVAEPDLSAVADSARRAIADSSS
jgi:hypothetical protein